MTWGLTGLLAVDISIDLFSGLQNVDMCQHLTTAAVFEQMHIV